ncbi:hypothetical protein P5V15_005645 [Pogonomyrmex californicus]
MSNSPRMRKMPPRPPKIILPVPGQYYSQPPTGMGYVPTPYGQTPVPMTPVSGQPQMIYANRASEFVFTQFKGIKDLTKSGLSVGEKSAYWLYEKVSSWSKRWFTHIFLFAIILLYSIAGAMIFIAVEGPHEKSSDLNMRQRRNQTLNTIREFCDDSVLASNMDLWRGRAINELTEYEKDMFQFFNQGLVDNSKKVWTFWNAVFYCGTIYTTIAYLSCAAFFWSRDRKSVVRYPQREIRIMYISICDVCDTTDFKYSPCFTYRFAGYAGFWQYRCRQFECSLVGCK